MHLTQGKDLTCHSDSVAAWLQDFGTTTGPADIAAASSSPTRTRSGAADSPRSSLVEMSMSSVSCCLPVAVAVMRSGRPGERLLAGVGGAQSGPEVFCGVGEVAAEVVAWNALSRGFGAEGSAGVEQGRAAVFDCVQG